MAGGHRSRWPWPTSSTGAFSAPFTECAETERTRVITTGNPFLVAIVLECRTPDVTQAAPEGLGSRSDYRLAELVVTLLTLLVLLRRLGLHALLEALADVRFLPFLSLAVVFYRAPSRPI